MSKILQTGKDVLLCSGSSTLTLVAIQDFKRVKSISVDFHTSDMCLTGTSGIIAISTLGDGLQLLRISGKKIVLIQSSFNLLGGDNIFCLSYYCNTTVLISCELDSKWKIVLFDYEKQVIVSCQS